MEGGADEDFLAPEKLSPYFGQGYYHVYRDFLMSPAHTRMEVDFLIRELRPQPGERWLDMACGYGRHLAALAAARRGLCLLTLDGCQDLAVLSGQPGAAAFDEFLPCHADEIGHLEGWPVHLGVSGWLVFLPRGCQRQGVQGTGRGVEMAGGKVQVLGGLFQIVVT